MTMLNDGDSISRISAHANETPVTRIIRLKREIIHAERIHYDEDSPKEFMDYAEELAKTVQDGSMASEPTEYFTVLNATLTDNFEDVHHLASKLIHNPIKDIDSARVFFGELNSWVKREKKRSEKTSKTAPEDTYSNPPAEISAIYKPSKDKEAYRLDQETVGLFKELHKWLHDKHHFPAESAYNHLVLHKMHGFYIMNTWKNLGGRICIVCAEHTHDENMKDCRHSWDKCPFRERYNIPLSVDPGRAYVEGTLGHYSNRGEGQLHKRAASDHQDQPPGKKSKGFQPKKQGGNKKKTPKKKIS